MSEIKVNKISPKQTCTTVTLGDSGDTFIIPSGVTLTNNGTLRALVLQERLVGIPHLKLQQSQPYRVLDILLIQHQVQ
jgi:hypothetical protein